MTASQIIARARSIADIPFAKYIDHSDELRSINESYRDVYSKLTDNDDDYYVTEVAITITAAMLVPGTLYEYRVPLPATFYKLRYVDYLIAGQSTKWASMKKFPLSLKNESPSEPYYRLQGNNLWVICSNFVTALPQLRVGYYPPPAEISCPMFPLVYGTSYLPSAFTGSVTAPAYAPYLEIMVYAYAGTGIRAESIRNGTVSAPVALFTESAAVTNIVYYKGVIYYIRGGLIWYKVTALQAAFVAPTQATSPAGVTSFFIHNNLIYYTTAAAIRVCNLTGAADALVMTVVANSVACTGISTVLTYYTTATGALVLVAPFTVLLFSGVSEVQSDGTDLYIRDTSFNLRKLSISVVGGVATIASDTQITSDVSDIGQPQYDVYQVPPIYIVPVLKDKAQTLQGMDTAIDYSFDYPENIVPEIIAFQCAVDFKAKKQADTTELKERLAALWNRFSQVIKRDEYKPTRIKQEYDHWGWGIR